MIRIGVIRWERGCLIVSIDGDRVVIPTKRESAKVFAKWIIEKDSEAIWQCPIKLGR